jgi:DNA-binding CsgD family transcriptional regulator
VPAVALLGGATAAAMSWMLRITGSGGFMTEPVATVALIVAAEIAAFGSSGFVAIGNRSAARSSRYLSFSLLIYLASSIWAVWLVRAPEPSAIAPVAVALWNTLWIPPLVLSQLTASASVRRRGTPWEHVAIVVVTAVVGVVNLLTETASDPFAGIPTIAPEAWSTAVAPVGALATALGFLAIIVLPVRLWAAAFGSQGVVRARLGTAAAGTTAAPITVLFCVLLAVARAPGAVDPSIGSVAFLVALAACASFATAAGLIAARGAVAPRKLVAVVKITAVSLAAVMVVAVGTVLASPALRWGAAALAITISIIAVVVVGVAWFGAEKLSHLLDPTAPEKSRRHAPPSSQITAHRPTGTTREGPAGTLTSREHEVLALLAEGSSNAGIAAQLVVSERTIDAHLRSIFVKLQLDQQPTSNRRVQAARIWFDVDS